MRRRPRVANSPLMAGVPPVSGCIKINVDAAVNACGHSSWQVETDAINVLRATKDPVSTATEANVISDIIEGCDGNRDGSICYVSRKGNGVTYFLSRYAISSSTS
ncbi:hypothetical protein TIFTF001_005226 [Ficus carica]|uniref:Uncharacterized protein n=1 Tax=Ficus carica TaxID=3494 RepID=A0AA87ZL69_FICCA|nr:hypothetical protein TIFTF001_005226 [Ficus carica]